MLACLAFALALAGCATSPPPDSAADQIPKSWRPDLLYLLPGPHPHLYVEVDAVEGCVPDDLRLEKMRQFLAAWCRKPDGIEIVRSDVIPRQAARGHSARGLARQYLNGPPASATNPAPAFLYVLFYDDALCFPPLVSAADESSTNPPAPPGRRPPVAHTCADIAPYPAIFFNQRFGPRMIFNFAMVHETGHILGLAGRTNHAAGFHCTHPGCLMNASIHLSRYVFGAQRHLCDECRAQLAASRQQPPPENLRFVGPVLVRAEPGYYVLSLPERFGLIAGDLTERDCHDFAAATRAERAGRDNDIPTSWQIKDLEQRTPDALRALREQALLDPFELVRSVWPRALALACANRYSELRQFANAAAMLRESIASNPGDDGAYNLLAWLKATCSEAAVRDGREAVVAATRACELTHWENGDWIDTLAAACAENHDFATAVRYEEQALRTGKFTPPAETEMCSRLALYRRSQPYHEAP